MNNNAKIWNDLYLLTLGDVRVTNCKYVSCRISGKNAREMLDRGWAERYFLDGFTFLTITDTGKKESEIACGRSIVNSESKRAK